MNPPRNPAPHPETLRILCLGLLCCLAASVRADPGKELPEPSRARIGSFLAVDLEPTPSQLRLGRGRVAWSHSFEIPGASFLKAHLAEVDLRAGDVLRIRDGRGRILEEITGRGPHRTGSFWTLSAFGPRLGLELEALRPYSRPPFRIDRLLAGEPDAFDASGPAEKTVCSAPDFEDVICYQADEPKWKNIQATVGIMTIDGSPNGAVFCTGSNVSGPGHVLTNAHCIENQAQCDGAEIVFGFHREVCGAGAPTTEWRSFRCGEVVATSTFASCEATPTTLDFTLATVQGDPTSEFAMAVTDATPLSDGEALYIVQHPRSRPKEITHGNGPDVVIDDIVLRYFGTLDTEIGSSGSPIFREADGKLVGLHHCGGCDGPEGNRGTAMTEILPHIEEFLCTEDLTLAGGGVEDVRELLGNGDGVIDAGETWQLRPRIRNTSCNSTAFGVTAELRLDPETTPGITLLDTEIFIGDISAGQASAAASPLRFFASDTTPCGGLVRLDLVEVEATNGGGFPDAPGIVDRTVGELVETTLFFDDFLAGFEAGWTVIDGGTGSGPVATWTTENPAERLVPLLDPFALADSDELGIGEIMDEQLLSPVIDVSGFAGIRLQLAHQFNWYPLGLDEQGDIDIRSTATDGEWVELVNFSGERIEGTESFDLTPWAQGQTDLQLRFHYYNARFEWWWALDDIYVLGNNGFVCHPFSPDIFADGFESGDTAAWTTASPLRPGEPASRRTPGGSETLR